MGEVPVRYISGTMDYTETQKKRMHLAAMRRDRETIKSSMLLYQATREKSIAEMRAAELEAARKKAALRTEEKTD
jgi:hypothetical protein